MKTLWLCMFCLLMQFQSGISEHNYNNTSLCRQDQMQFLLQLSHHLHQNDSYWNFECDRPENYYKTKYWHESLDCCDWDGVTCDGSTGFVVGLDLSCGGLTGNIHSNSTLFRLTRLQNLNLAFNHFNGSQISPEFGWLSSLTHLNLSYSDFNGQIPQELYYLSNLISLDISSEYVDDSDKIYCDIRLLSKNMTKIEVLMLREINISSEIPTNMTSSLTHLDLGLTGVHGILPTSFFERPNLQILRLGGNPGLQGSLPDTFNRSNVHSFRELDLSSTNISGRLPESISLLENLVYMDLAQTNISGRLPESISLLSNLVDLDLSWTSISGRLPESIGLLSNLVHMVLLQTKISGRLPESVGLLKNLVRMDLAQTNISGRLPESIGLLENLDYMDIKECNLWGPIPESIGNITKIQYIDMSMNKLSGEVPPTISNLRHLLQLDLSSNNLGGKLPDAFANLQYLDTLFLRNNSFLGEIPTSLFNMSRLDRLDISSNALTGFFPSGGGNLLRNLRILEMSNNFLREYPPWLYLQNLQYLYLNSNEFEGTFPSSLCNITSLSYLDLSNNKFRGRLPPCIGNSSNTLEVLLLSRNEFSGTIPATVNGHNLIILELSDNHMEGRLPQSLANCTKLHFLDLGKNMFHGTFPRWLQTLPNLGVLILKSNNIHGSLSPPVSNDSFSELRIIDLSHNNFTGLLPGKLFASFLTMKTHDSHVINYAYSVTISVKGDDREFTKVRPIVMTIDLSSNNFYGSIPQSLADLTSLWLLNLSHNHLSGSIPPAFGHLATLEQLDLSSNRLTGGIPHTLTNLTFLEVLNLSYNHLVGPIPEGGQFSTFPRESYIGNLGLYGAPLTKSYGNGQEPPSPTVTQEDEDDDDSGFMTGFTWQAVAQGYGCGVVIGFVIGSVMLCIGKPRWFARFYYTEAANCLRRRNKRPDCASSEMI